MYEEHFGLTGRPFQLTPDPEFWFETATHRKAMAYLGYGLAQGEGFIVITGDIGAGKTTLMGHLTEQLDPQALNVIKIVSSAIEADDLLRIVATALGVDPDGLTKAQLLTAIERGLHAVARTGRRTLVIVDEAQSLPVSALEELRMLSNFQARGHALVQIVLLGQPEFRDRLHGSDRLEQLRQRVIAIHHLDPMAEDEVADYIAHRLTRVGWKGKPDFAADAFAALFQGSHGVPRRLNQLAGRVMLHAAVEHIDLIDGRTVRAVLRDLHADLPLMAVGKRPADPAPEPVVVEHVAPEPEPAADTEAPRRFVPSSARWLVIDDASDAPNSDGDGVEVDGPAGLVDSETADPVAEESATIGEWTVDVEPETADDDDVSVAEQKIVEDTPTVEARAPAADEESSPLVDADRLAALEARVEQQDAALRRVLTLLVDWVEGEGKGPPPGIAGSSADADYAPIKRAVAWDDAA